MSAPRRWAALLAAALLAAPAGPARATPPAVAWSVPMPYADVLSPVRVRDGRVHVVRRGGVQTLDARTGAQLWSAPIAPVGQGPAVLAVAGGRVFVAHHPGGSRPTPHRLTALDARTGEPLWTAEIHRIAGLAAEADTLAVDVRAASPPGGGRVRVLGAAGGQPRWTVRISNRGVAVAGSRLVADGGGFDLATGAPVWPTTADGMTVLAVTPDGGRLLGAVGPSDALVRLDAATGAPDWRVDADSIEAGVDDGAAVYTLTSAHAREPAVTARDAATGAVRWRRPSEAFGHEFGYGMAAARGVLYVRDDMFCYPLAAATGTPLPRPALDGACEDLALTDDLVLYRDAERLTAHPLH
ncbi:hypothetical protein GCM10010123_43600 [Pilimelia anulata]|uniref:Pyrrolo-quinoline quinone repeat domain-containing protein n=1 Tax=Pilimelia anulata TaxID=53371 RepID=A0A8J3FDA3_9ACTN|nr:PQQ-binding-like beta-propeller repeat protein [Pilimelia anulata]GGK08999.1 hypothetical protein GCM10010123_43600 [Pilimelia anulata]